MQESQQRLLDEQLQLSLDTNKTGLSISSHDSQIDLLEQYTKVFYFFIKNGTAEKDHAWIVSPEWRRSLRLTWWLLKFEPFLIFFDELNLLFQKYNLLFFGLAEEPDEDPEQLVRNILQTKMDIILKDKDIEFAEVRLFWCICLQEQILKCNPLAFICIFHTLVPKRTGSLLKICFDLLLQTIDLTN